MHDLAIMWDWLGFAVRWLHVVTAIAWIGSSFYFVALDLGLRAAPDLPPGAAGEEWQVHGGGFYHIRKYLVAPERMPAHLTWFKWESYATWLSGAALLMILYWAGAELYMIDPSRADLAVWQAVALSAGALALGWLGYDALCRSPLRTRPRAVMAVLFAGIAAASWALDQVFTGRAALLHLGAMTATIMTANVFFVIIPNQRIVVADLRAGRRPDPELGRIAKLRSTHNNYLTLPVLFLMLSNHYPLAFGTGNAWIIACLVFAIGVVVRHYFNTLHATGEGPLWTWGAAAVIFLVLAWLSTAPLRLPAAEAAELPPRAERFAAAEGFAEVTRIVAGRCSMCHARAPAWEGVRRPPGGVVLESPGDVARAARRVYLQAGVSRAMPPGNLGRMRDAERDRIVAWYRAGAGG